jgi:hypothetical protein
MLNKLEELLEGKDSMLPEGMRFPYLGTRFAKPMGWVDTPPKHKAAGTQLKPGSSAGPHCPSIFAVHFCPYMFVLKF